MKFITIFILAFLIFILTFDREGHAALNSGDAANPLYVQSFDVSDQATSPRVITFNNDVSKMYIRFDILDFFFHILFMRRRN